jgi:hypothetical protein
MKSRLIQILSARLDSVPVVIRPTFSKASNRSAAV